MSRTSLSTLEESPVLANSIASSNVSQPKKQSFNHIKNKCSMSVCVHNHFLNNQSSFVPVNKAQSPRNVPPPKDVPDTRL